MKKFIIIIVLLFSLTASLHSQWIKQNWPVFESIYGTCFFDANTGLVAMKTYPSSLFKIYRTTNGGFNWSENYRPLGWIYQSQKIDDSTVYVLGDDRTNYYIYRTYNRGISWDSIQYPSIDGLYFINKDTGWSAMFTGSQMRFYQTVNAGLTFNLLSSIPASGPYDIKFFFLKEKYNGSYVGYRSSLDLLKKTTDGGYTWIDLPGLPGANDTYLQNGKKLINEIRQITFINKDTGWVTNGTNKIYKTLNGGNSWIGQSMPSGIYMSENIAWNFDIVNNEILYANGGNKYYGGNIMYGIIFKTTNSGVNWGYQQPDTLFSPYSGFSYPSFINQNTGWFSKIYTTNGGGPIIYTDIKKISVEHPEQYQLMQNYPNPFNPSTTIDFYLPKSSTVYLRVYDIAGRLILKVIEGFQLTSGYHSYRIDGFSSLGLSSGVYFYKLTSSDKSGSTTFQATKKMIYSK